MGWASGRVGELYFQAGLLAMYLFLLAMYLFLRNLGDSTCLLLLLLQLLPLLQRTTSYSCNILCACNLG